MMKADPLASRWMTTHAPLATRLSIVGRRALIQPDLK